MAPATITIDFCPLDWRGYIYHFPALRSSCSCFLTSQLCRIDHVEKRYYDFNRTINQKLVHPKQDKMVLALPKNPKPLAEWTESELGGRRIIQPEELAARSGKWEPLRTSMSEYGTVFDIRILTMTFSSERTAIRQCCCSFDEHATCGAQW